MGHRSSKQLEEAPSKAIIFQTVQSNNLTILYLKMKIFFVLASLIYFPCSVVLDMNDCGSGISDVCQSEWDDKESVWKFYERCDAEGGSNPLRWSCSLCCPDSNCDATCGCGFTKTSQGLSGEGQEWSYPGDTLDSCAAECRYRIGCTSFEYNHAGNEALGGMNKCGTYTGGAANLNPSQISQWTSCIQGILLLLFFLYLSLSLLSYLMVINRNIKPS